MRHTGEKGLGRHWAELTLGPAQQDSIVPATWLVTPIRAQPAPHPHLMALGFPRYASTRRLFSLQWGDIRFSLSLACPSPNVASLDPQPSISKTHAL